MPLCICGCGKEAKNKFVLGHNTRINNPWTGRNWQFNKGKSFLLNDNNPSWKGESASLTAKHNWIRRRYGKANMCEINPSHSATRYHWSNKDHKYQRVREDWKMLCPKCHFKVDGQTGSTRSEEFKKKVSIGLKKAYQEGRRKK